DSAEAAWRKIRAGATLVQLYTGMVYQGFGIARAINGGLLRLLDRSKNDTIEEVVGRDAVAEAAAKA
ncbi:MAG TPA: dihydroorotate dehydrogenase (quinone), partial [Xanthobacteraceae bacterium]|nr:dihydroorotate dehydrogenase (quinone) [Xanthobacteraceae bacterium]